MSEHDEIYGQARAAQLLALLRYLAERIRALDGQGDLLAAAPELQRLLGDARSELFHYEVRSEARQHPFPTDEPEDDEPWRPPQAG